MDIKTAAAYIRVSTEDQIEYSPDAQLRELREYASSHNMILDDRFVYADEGISGRKADKRPAFQEMIRTAKLKDHPFDVILVHKFDRFARSREDSVVYKSMLKRCGVDVISIKEPLAEGSYSGVMEAIYESFAEAYSINLGTEVKKGMTEKARRGEIQTAPPYGYMLAQATGNRQQATGYAVGVVIDRPPNAPPPQSPSVGADDHIGPSMRSASAPVWADDHIGPNPRTFVPHPIEAEYVREIFRRFASGEGLFPIAKWLTASGQRTHRGNAFENRTVEYILRNPVYVGKLRWNPARRSRRDFDDPEIIVADGHHEPLISMELWDACQKRMAEVKALHPYHGRPAGDRHHWLCGIVRCAACDSTLIWSKPYYLKCNNYVRGRCSHTQHIKAELLEQAVIAQLKAHVLEGPPPAARLIRLTGKVDSRLQLLRHQLDAVEKKQERLLEAYLNGADIPIPRYNEMTAAMNEEAAALRAELESLESSGAPSAAEQSASLRSQISATLATLESETATLAQKHEAAAALIEHCTFDKSTMLLSITYRLTV